MSYTIDEKNQARQHLLAEIGQDSGGPLSRYLLQTRSYDASAGRGA